MEILKATTQDLPDIVKMGRKFFYEAKWQEVYKWDNEEATIALSSLIGNPDVIMLIAKDTKTIGMVAGMIYPLWYNPKIKTAQELYLYVTPERRHSLSGVGHRLKTYLEEEVRIRGVNTMVMGSVEAMPNLDKYYARCGYAPSEKTYIKRL